MNTGPTPVGPPTSPQATSARRFRAWAGVRRVLGRWVPPALLLAALVAVWEVWVIVRHTPKYVVPSPGRVAGAFFESAHLLPGHVATTVEEALIGLVVGAAAGVALAALLVLVPLARRVLEPLLVTSQTIPMIVLAPILAFWFGIGIAPKILVVALITFFPVAVSTASGLTDVDPEMVELVRSMGASPRRTLRVVAVPHAVPAFFAGLRIAAAYAVAGAVIGELVGGQRGLGVFITREKASFRMDRLLVAVFVIAALSSILFALINVLARLATPWKRGTGTPMELA